MPPTAARSAAAGAPRPPAQVLHLKPGHRLLLLAAPAGWPADPLPDGVTVRRRRAGPPADVVVAFARTAAALAADAAGWPELLAAGGSLWVAWPRKAAGHVSDLGDGVVRRELLATGLVDTLVARLDEDWSSLRFQRRRAP